MPHEVSPLGKVGRQDAVEQRAPLRVNEQGALASGATGVFALTKSDATTYNPPLRGVYVGGAGDVAIKGPDGVSAVFTAVPVGTFMPVEAYQVLATGTTATLLVGLR